LAYNKIVIKSLFSLYSWRYPRALVYMLQSSEYRVGAFLGWYWRTTDFGRIARNPFIIQPRSRRLLLLLRLGMVLQLAIGLLLIIGWRRYSWAGGAQFGLAIILSYPIVWAHVLALMVALWWLGHPKALGRAVVCRILESQVKRLRRRHSFSVVGVVGSVGKTSTKIAIARLLQVSRRVKWQEGNYNDRVTVPLIFFGHAEPNILNALAWLKIFCQNELIIRKVYPYQVVVAELGTDGPGFMREFAYVKPDLVVVTAVTPEHMEYFGTLEAVAREELSALSFSKRALVNVDDTSAEYLADRDFLSYGTSPKTNYRVTKRDGKGLHGQEVVFDLNGKHKLRFTTSLLGEHGAKIALAAVAAADLMGLEQDDIEKGVAGIGAFAGRMQVLPGILNSTIIDDTYNSSPVAAKAALDVLQSGDAPQRIAIMGSMNELGDYSPQAHREVGEYCDPSKLDLLITIGPDAKEYLAPIAKERGCNVKTFLDPYKAGRYVKKQLKEGAVVLAKGSQNRVFAEESLKVLLASKDDESKLVRQSSGWMAKKAKQFKP
jgi:UDP-N-acetylmuramoyl-tripeptide--D-alanyl-D-alanine ligase